MRVKLSEKCKEEREEICNKIISILKLSEKQTFLLSELDSNIEKQNELLGMKEEIQKYFACSTISSFKPNFECKRPYLNIVRGILRKQGYTFKGDDILLKLENGTYIKTMKYKICRDN
jgi:hypothetical protein